MAKDDSARAGASPPPPRTRVITHRGRPLLVSNRDLPPDVLDHVVDFYEAKDRGEGPAAQMMRFVQPLLEAAGDDKAKMDHALSLGMACWNLALCKDEPQREEMMAELLNVIAEDDEDAPKFRAVAADMVERHKAMFPALHGESGRAR